MEGVIRRPQPHFLSSRSEAEITKIKSSRVRRDAIYGVHLIFYWVKFGTNRDMPMKYITNGEK